MDKNALPIDGHDADLNRGAEASVAVAPISSDIITEAEAYERFGHLLEDKELRVARQEGRLGYLRRKRKIFYRLSELQTFIDAALNREYRRKPMEPEATPIRTSISRLNRVSPHRPAPDPTSKVGGALSRTAQKIARAEGRI